MRSALVIEDVQDVGEVICVRARTRGRAVACPGCGTETTHGYHERTAADVPSTAAGCWCEYGFPGCAVLW